MSTMDQNELDKVVDHGALARYGVVYRKGEGYWDRDKRFLHHKEGGEHLPDFKISFSMYEADWAWNRSYSYDSPVELRQEAQLLSAAADLLEAFDEHMADVRAERKAEEAKRNAEYEARRKREREEREKRAAEKANRDAERSERMLTEFMGEPVRVRIAGYRSAVKAVVDATPVRKYVSGEGYVETGNYIPILKYANYNDAGRPKDVGSIERLEVKVGSRYELVWDDDPDADGSGNREVRPYDGGLS